ncbi:MAG: site-specific integrase [Rhodospirillales bacterium]|nr:site-specific integrase [Rhodospirillales bacterium]
MDALLAWWGDAMLSTVTAAACRRYSKERKESIERKKAETRAAVVVRYEAKGLAPPPLSKTKVASDNTTRRELAVLRAAINWCQTEGYVVQAPSVWLPDRPQARERWLTREEAAKLIRAARQLERAKTYLPRFIMLGLYTGARKEAILGLQWQSNTVGGRVDLERGLIDYRKPGQAQTAKRRTAIPVPPRLQNALRAARKTTRQYVLEFQGQPIGDMKKAFAAAARAAGLRDVTPHTLRHTAVTWLVQGGVSLWEVAQWVGMSVEMIERVYGHHAPDRFAKVLAAQR